MAQKYTPTPWIAAGNWIQVQHEDGKHIRPIGNVESEANAAHIVHCVNNYDALIEAVKHGAMSTHHPACKNYGQDSRCTCHVAKCRAALDSVKGGE